MVPTPKIKKKKSHSYIYGTSYSGRCHMISVRVHTRKFLLVMLNKKKSLNWDAPEGTV